VINERNALYGEFSAKKGETVGENAGIVGMSTAKKMGKRHDEPKTLDTDSGADLVLVEGEDIFGLAEKDFDGPSFGVEGQDFVGG
jgi:hypothetical protein